MAKKDDGQFFMVFVGGKPEGGDDGGSPAGLFLGLLAIALAMIFFAALLRDAERRQQNYYPRSYFPPTQSNVLQPAADGTR